MRGHIIFSKLLQVLKTLRAKIPSLSFEIFVAIVTVVGRSGVRASARCAVAPNNNFVCEGGEQTKKPFVLSHEELSREADGGQEIERGVAPADRHQHHVTRLLHTLPQRARRAARVQRASHGGQVLHQELQRCGGRQRVAAA